AVLASQVVDQVTGDKGGHETEGRSHADTGQHHDCEAPVRNEVTEDALEQRPLQLDIGLRLLKAAVPPIHARKPTQPRPLSNEPGPAGPRERRFSAMRAFEASARALADADRNVPELAPAD